MTWPDRIPLELTEDELVDLQLVISEIVELRDANPRFLKLLKLRKKLRAAQVQAFAEAYK
jgi:hypothetical protein